VIAPLSSRKSRRWRRTTTRAEIGASLQLGQYLAHALRVSIQLTSERAKPFLLRCTLGRVVERVLL
jgi:hypothetical protein